MWSGFLAVDPKFIQSEMWSGFLVVDPKFANLSSAPIERRFRKVSLPPCASLLAWHCEFVPSKGRRRSLARDTCAVPALSARRLKTAEDGAGSAVSEHIDCNSPPGVRARSRVARAAARILSRGACVRSQIASPRIAGPKHDMQDDLHVRCRPTAGAEAAGGGGHPMPRAVVVCRHPELLLPRRVGKMLRHRARFAQRAEQQVRAAARRACCARAVSCVCPSACARQPE